MGVHTRFGAIIFRSTVLALSGLTLTPRASDAIEANPTLAALVDGVQDEAAERPLRLSRLDVDVRIHGAVVQVSLTSAFSNPGEETLEGQYKLALPAEAALTGYALDVDDHIIEGVLAEEPRAKAIYASKVRAGIDPGIAEISRGRIFSTRVYPIEANGERTIRLTFAAPIHPRHGLALPLRSDAPLDRLSIRVVATGVAQPPELTLPAGLVASFTRMQNEFRLEAGVANAVLAGELDIREAVPASAVIVSRHRNTERFFHLREPIGLAPAPRPNPRRLRVYWDRSRSRRDDDLEAELDLLARYVRSAGPATIDVIAFNSAGAVRASASEWSEVQRLLTSQAYRGGTTFEVLRNVEAPPADLCLLFSDGLQTIDDRGTDLGRDCEALAITSSREADHALLARLTAQTATDVINLHRLPVEGALKRLMQIHPRVLSVRDRLGRELRHAVLSIEDGAVSIVGEAPRGERLTVEWLAPGVGRVRRSHRVDTRQTVDFDGPGALWAVSHAGALSDESRAEIVDLSRRYHVATPMTAFIVLDTPEDYVEAELTPPPTYPTAWLEEYREAKAIRDEETEQLATERLEEVVDAWEEQKAWWSRQFDALESPRPAAPRGRRPRSGSGLPAALGGGELDQIVVTGQRVADAFRAASIENLDANAIQIELAEWSPDRPYLQRLTGSANTDVALMDADREFGQSPAFYLDVAEWLHRRRQAALAIEFLLSALELPHTNEETILMVAHRLRRYGELERAIDLYERLVRLAPHRPQPLRNLALALAERAGTGSRANARKDWRRALELLNQVVTRRWDDAYEGIELIALMEANDMIERMRRSGIHGHPLDPRLVALLDVDVRATIEWNTDGTDIDLWIEEASGERAGYSNQLTAIGGRLSNDMTDGYGPEEYLLRRAPEGVYRVEVDTYAPDLLNPNGAAIVTLRLIRDFGRETQTEETLDVELRPEEEGTRLVGEFKVVSGVRRQ